MGYKFQTHVGRTDDAVIDAGAEGTVIAKLRRISTDMDTAKTRAASTDTIGAALMTNVISNGTTALTPKFASISAASSGDNTLVAAVTDKKIRVLSAILVVAGDVDVAFESGASGTALTGDMSLAADGNGFVLGFNPVGWFETAVSTLLNLELSAAVQASGCLTYVEV